MVGQLARSTILSAVGSIILLVGAYLPWLHENTDLNGRASDVYVPGMHAGFELFDFLLIGVAGAVLLMDTIIRRRRVRAIIVTLAGIGTIFVCVLYVTGYSPLIGFDSELVPALGWYLTLLGGLLLTVAGAIEVPDMVRDFQTRGTTRS